MTNHWIDISRRILVTSRRIFGVLAGFLVAASAAPALGAPIPTITSVTASANPSVAGSLVTFNIDVQPQSGSESVSGAFVLTFIGPTLLSGTGTVNAGKGSYDTDALSVGVYTVEAGFADGSDFVPSEDFTNQTVVAASNVPEPGSLALLVGGLAMFVIARSKATGRASYHGA